MSRNTVSNQPDSIDSFELVTDGLAFPSSIAFDESGNAWVGETGLPFGGAKPGARIWKLESDGKRNLVAENIGFPLTGLVWHDGSLWVSQGSNPGRIDRIDPETGEKTTILDDLPGGGNYHTGEVAFGPDGKMYWGQGAMTNTGIVGLDALDMGWLKKLPHSIDIPGYDIVLNDVRVTTRNPLVEDKNATATTGPFSQFGETMKQGTRIAGSAPATSAVMRANPDGTGIELVAWGTRNPFGLRFLPDGRLLAMDQGADDRGSRPVANVPDYLWEIKPGAWYGWPDFMGGIPITDERFTPVTGAPPTFILANHDELPTPEKPLVEFTSHTASTKFAVDPRSDGKRIVASLFGDETPMTAAPGHPTVGRALVVIDTADWSTQTITTNQLHRPIDVRFNPADGSLWVVDFGEFEMKGGSSGVTVAANANSGAIWRLARLP